MKTCNPSSMWHEVAITVFMLAIALLTQSCKHTGSQRVNNQSRTTGLTSDWKSKLNTSLATEADQIRPQHPKIASSLERLSKGDAVKLVYYAVDSLEDDLRSEILAHIERVNPPSIITSNLSNGHIAFVQPSHSIVISDEMSSYSYSHFRRIISHELVHYYIQREFPNVKDGYNNSFSEGVTEYIALRAMEKCRWVAKPLPVYEDSTRCVALLVTAGIGTEIFDWFTSTNRGSSTRSWLELSTSSLLASNGMASTRAITLASDLHTKERLKCEYVDDMLLAHKSISESLERGEHLKIMGSITLESVELVGDIKEAIDGRPKTGPEASRFLNDFRIFMSLVAGSDKLQPFTEYVTEITVPKICKEIALETSDQKELDAIFEKVMMINSLTVEVLKKDKADIRAMILAQVGEVETARKKLDDANSKIMLLHQQSEEIRACIFGKSGTTGLRKKLAQSGVPGSIRRTIK